MDERHLVQLHLFDDEEQARHLKLELDAARRAGENLDGFEWLTPQQVLKVRFELRISRSRRADAGIGSTAISSNFESRRYPDPWQQYLSFEAVRCRMSFSSYS